MNNLRQDLTKNTKIIKHYIKDLSFENLQDVNCQELRKNDVEISNNINLTLETYDEKNFSVLLKYSCYCTLIKNEEKIFILEIDYFGLFIKSNIKNHSQDDLTKIGSKLLFPLLKPVVEYVTKNGAPITISLKDLDFNQLKKTSS